MKPIPRWSINHPFLVSSLNIGGESLPIDKDIKPLCLLLNKHAGIKTFASCADVHTQGCHDHYGTITQGQYVATAFIRGTGDVLKFIEFVDKLDVRSDCPYQFSIELRKRTKKLKPWMKIIIETFEASQPLCHEQHLKNIRNLEELISKKFGR